MQRVTEHRARCEDFAEIDTMTTTLERGPLLPRWSGLLDWPEWPSWFDRLDMAPMARLFERDGMSRWIRVEETQNKDHLEIRAELPGIDPDHDVDITVAEGVLTICAERKEQTEHAEDGRTMSEFHYGSLRRTLHVPKSVKATDITASYKDGILHIKVPLPKSAKTEAAKVLVSRG